MNQRQTTKDIFGIILFIVAVIVGAWLINSMVFRSFSVLGPSMQPTMDTGDRLIINRIPVTIQALQGDDYLPQRGHTIVFRNPSFDNFRRDEYIVKRVIGLPGDRVVVANGDVTVFNDDNPEGLDPYTDADIVEQPVLGNIEQTVPVGEIFVIGDNHSGNESYDSRNGLGTVPLKDVVGPVALRIYPFEKLSADF